MLLRGRAQVLTTVPPSQGIILELLREAVVASLGHTPGFLIGGYPQEVKQGKEFGRRVSAMRIIPEGTRDFIEVGRSIQSLLPSNDMN